MYSKTKVVIKYLRVDCIYFTRGVLIIEVFDYRANRGRSAKSLSLSQLPSKLTERRQSTFGLWSWWFDIVFEYPIVWYGEHLFFKYFYYYHYISDNRKNNYNYYYYFILWHKIISNLTVPRCLRFLTSYLQNLCSWFLLINILFYLHTHIMVL